MKLERGQLDRFLTRPDPAVRAVVIYGPDEGLVRERAQILARKIVPDPADAFQIETLAAEAVAADPSLLADEAASPSLLGGARLIRIRDGSDKVTRALALLLEGQGGDGLAVIEAGELTPRSSLRKLAESAPNAAAIACYVESEGELGRTLESQLRDAGKSIEPDALKLLAASLVGDRMIARGEVDKLILYLGEAPTIRLADVEALVVDTTIMGMDDAAAAAASGDPPALDRCLARLAREGASGIAVLRQTQTYFRRLHITRARFDATGDLERAVGQLQPPLFFKLKPTFSAQTRRWPLDRLAAALDDLVEAEARSKRTGANDWLLASEALLTIAGSVRGT